MGPSIKRSSVLNTNDLKRESIICAIAAGLATGLQAADWDPGKLLAYKLGPVTLRPQLGISETYNDNVFYLPRSVNAIDDFITTISPGLSFSLGREETVNPWMGFYQPEANFVALSYQFDHIQYAKTPYLDSDNHALALRSRIKGNRLSVNGSDQAALINGIMGGATSYRRNISRLVLADQYTVAYNLSEKTRFYVGARHDTTDYENTAPFYDITSWRVTDGAGYNLGRTSFFAETHYAQSIPSPNQPITIKAPTLDYLGGYLGAQGRFTERLTGTVKAGYEVHSYSDGSDAPDTPIVEVSLTHIYRQNTATVISYSRQTIASPEAAGVAYNADIFGIQLNQRFGPEGKIQARLGTDLQLYDYSQSRTYANRSDAWCFGRFGLVYLVRAWWQIGFSYQYEYYSSTYKGIIDYTVNRATLHMTIGY
jgi:hypothetical protein